MGGKMLLEAVLQMQQRGAHATIGGSRGPSCARAIALREMAGENFLRGSHGKASPEDGISEKCLFFVGLCT